MKRHTFAYYCSGHGYGHATRVSAFTSHLLSLEHKPVVYIVSSAPQLVFSDSIALGALYRNVNIDPVIVQPLAYRVDRQASLRVLKRFLDRKDDIVEEESRWLKLINADCVLSDAAFIGCAAANSVGIPSVLITNFTFDSVFSYLSTLMVDDSDSQQDQQLDPAAGPLLPDVPIPFSDLEPLVKQIWSGYRCADLLLRLPGAIPVPSFFDIPMLPSPNWVDSGTRSFTPQIISRLLEPPMKQDLLGQIPFPRGYPAKKLARSVISMPLLVRPPDATIYTPFGRDRLLDTIGVPEQMRDRKILIVSFGGQIFHKPHCHSRVHSQCASGLGTPDSGILAPSKVANTLQTHVGCALSNIDHNLSALSENAGKDVNTPTSSLGRKNSLVTRSLGALSRSGSRRSRAQSILMVPGAPPASIPNSPISATTSMFDTLVIPPTPKLEDTLTFSSINSIVDLVDEEEEGSLLPDDSWIAVVCGVPKDWAAEGGEDLPDSFFVAPKDVYMPDLTAIADVLLGKLGYGTVSECVDACTPFVYVPRPLFIEEHGLRLYLEKEGVGIELSRSAYEAGDWAAAVQEAYEQGKGRKSKKKAEGETGKLVTEGMRKAAELVDWVRAWKD
ncbi:hypothetical protein BDY19DRAFT_984075 [Irpex rosettiformis]|uniref:Uncharacterized protein n=1 Tax=Irpex rosettiformis TaxID=378272 RepID=A0ACB8U9W6_9APHY|nr:hypothetical protein BDY19DRAFT_984075 [Irpex rosettiformis]